MTENNEKRWDYINDLAYKYARMRKPRGMYWQDLEESLQDHLGRLAKRSVDRIDNLNAYIGKLVVNAIRDAQKRPTHHPLPVEEPIANNTCQSDEEIGNEFSSEVLRILSSDFDQDIRLALLYVLDLDSGIEPKEFAKKKGITIKAAYKRIGRARIKLQTKLGPKNG